MARAETDPKPKPTDREQKLAQALRANLRRRKAGEHPAATSPRGTKSGDDS
jgi:hypothetical protein